MESLGTVMMTFLLFTAASKRWLGCGRTENPRPRRDGLSWFCDNYCTVILRCSFALRVIGDILWSCYLDEDKMCVFDCVYISSWRDCLETICQTLFLSLWGIRLNPKTSKTSESTASLSLAERWTITEILRQLNSVLTYSLLTDVLLYGFKVLSLVKIILESASVNLSNLFLKFITLTFG